MSAVLKQNAPRLPVQYDVAVRALVECQSIDDAKEWDNKADALAAWAKIYKDNEVSIQAKRLKLHAYRRMYQLANEIQPKKFGSKGPWSLFQEHGFSKSAANRISRIGRLAQAQFDAVVTSENPPSPTRLVVVNLSKNPEWRLCQTALSHARNVINKMDRYRMAKKLSINEAKYARQLVDDLMLWCEEFKNEIARAGALK
jgi:hypothetical protein